MAVETALPEWRVEFIDMLTAAPESYLDQLADDSERALQWWRAQLGTPPDGEWTTAVRTMVHAHEDRLADIWLERVRRG